METVFSYVAPPSRCGYLPNERWSLEYEMVAELTSRDYLTRLTSGWRRFGHMLFRPRCSSCRKCQSLRVKVNEFRPNRSQRRAARANSDVALHIGAPSVSKAKLRLYDKYHAFQAERKNWPEHPAKDAASYRHSFVDNPIYTEEWCYYVAGKLLGVGYVDVLAGGLSAIYYFYDPDERPRSLGTWNVLCLVEECLARGLPHLYLGYYVEGCASLAYKANFIPNQILNADGVWCDFRT